MAHSMADLLKITEYWLNEVTHSEFIEFLNNNISQYIDVDLNQSSFKKYNDFISKKIYNMKKSFIDSINVKKEIINSNSFRTCRNG